MVTGEDIFAGDVHDAFGGTVAGLHCAGAINHNSTDAALALKDAVLPERVMEIVIRPLGVRPHKAHVMLKIVHTGWGKWRYANGTADTPARALLIAILKALIAEEDNAQT